MDETRALSAVTRALRQLIENQLGGAVRVGVRPPDLVETAAADAALNLYLYQVERSGRWHNLPMPGVGKSPNAPAPLGLILRYLLTAFGDDDFGSQDALEGALGVLSDLAILKKELIRTIAPASSAVRQTEPLRVTILNVEARDLFHLWSTFQSPYRTSVMFEVEVVLVESRKAADAPVPVIRRGPVGAGPSADVGVTPPFPTITAVEPSNPVLLGEAFRLLGSKLDQVAELRLVPWPDPDPDFDPVTLPVPAAARSSDAVQAAVDPALGPWRAGAYRITAVTPEPAAGAMPAYERESNAATIEVAPRIVSVAVNGGAAVPDPGPGAGPLPTIPALAQGADRRVDFDVAVEPAVRPSQRVRLMLNGRQVPAEPRGAGPVAVVTFRPVAVVPGTYWLRLRVDGVDTRLVDRLQEPPSFRAFRVEVT